MSTSCVSRGTGFARTSMLCSVGCRRVMKRGVGRCSCLKVVSVICLSS